MDLGSKKQVKKAQAPISAMKIVARMTVKVYIFTRYSNSTQVR